MRAEASPYANTDGAIEAITLARTARIPFLGTCGGFQHAIIEYFRNVIGLADASHAELDPETDRSVISRLSCSLVEVTGTIRLVPGSWAQRLYGADCAEEGYHCSYGLNPEFARAIEDRNDLLVEGTDNAGDIRIVRLRHHPFFMATLFQPERSSMKGLVHPLIREFVCASACRPPTGRLRRIRRRRYSRISPAPDWSTAALSYARSNNRAN